MAASDADDLSTSEDVQPFQSSRTKLRRHSSCQALRHAVLQLHRIDDFTMCKIGSGFFSEVFKVTHKTSGAVMVLKMNTSEDNRPNMLREVQLMNKMSHANILKFLGVCVHKGQLHALTEFINGGSLHETLCGDETTPMLWCDRVKIGADVACGMQYLHSKNLFHRDLTSRNILIDVTSTDGKQRLLNRAVIADFGLATTIPDPCVEFHLSVVGSPFWIAPECITGQPYDETADIFSFGIVLCEIIARIDADPDVLPRTQTFGLDYIAYSDLVDNCPLHFLYLAFICCLMEPKKRPPFTELYQSLQKISTSHLEVFDGESAMASAVTPTDHPAVNKRGSFYAQRSISEQTLDFLGTSECQHLCPSAKVIGKHMTREDPLYQPAPANTNPFADNAQLCAGKKLVASELERQQTFELGTTLPLETKKIREDVNNNNKPFLVTRQSLSLPSSPGVVQRAIAQFDAQILASSKNRNETVSPIDSLFTSCDSSMDGQQFARHSIKQRNLECAMLFCGLDLIQMQRASLSEQSDTNISSIDLESEFQDDLEDVLRQSQWTPQAGALSPMSDSAFGDVESDWLLSLEDSGTNRYLHPTLVEKRKQLRRVEVRKKEKLEQLHQKLEQLRLTAKSKSKLGKLRISSR